MLRYVASSACIIGSSETNVFGQAESAKAEQSLAEERATLSRYDEEIKSLDRVIKEKKQSISEAELKLTQLEHDIGSLKKERTTAEHFAGNLEKQYDWIVEERECVYGLVVHSAFN